MLQSYIMLVCAYTGRTDSGNKILKLVPHYTVGAHLYISRLIS
jgi:hypothetical protein